MLALSALYEGFARGVVYLHTAQLPVPKHSAAKPCISITSKLIESRGVHPDEGASCGGQAGVHPVAPGAVFGNCEVLPHGWERIFGWDSSRLGERGGAEEAGTGKCFNSADGAGRATAE